MGLDMYLYAKTYMSPFGEESKDAKIIAELSGLDKLAERTHTSLADPEQTGVCVNVSVEMMYWRKANQIHAWFVENIQNGNDDCGTYYVDEGALIDLKNTCDHIIAHPNDAMKMLPPSSGFFFGSSVIDEWYMEQIVYTSKRISEILNIKKDNDMWVDFYYHSSW